VRLLKVLYYYNYLFYTKIIPDDEPHATVIFTLSFTELWYLISLIDFITINFYCYKTPLSINITIMIGLLLFNYIVFFRSGRGVKLIDKKPMIYNNYASIIITIIFELVGISYMFFGSIWTKSILSSC
jgi:hypothetical protein